MMSTGSVRGVLKKIAPQHPTLQPKPPALTPQAPAPARPAQPAASPAPAPQIPGVTGAAVTPIAPGENDLRGSMITPGADPRLASVRGDVDSARAALSTAPSRVSMVSQGLADYDTANAPLQAARFRKVGQQAAKFGRLGSGMVTTELGNLQSDYERDRLLAGNQMLRDAVTGDIDDRFRKVGALSGLEGQQFSQGSIGRGELRDERGYQDNLAQQSIENQIRERLLQEQLLSGQFGRDATRFQLGYSTDPSRAYNTAADRFGQTASDSFAGMEAILAEMMRARSQPQPKAG